MLDFFSQNYWLVLCTPLVFLMIPSLALIGSGSVRVHSAISQLSSSLLIFGHGSILYYLVINPLVFKHGDSLCLYQSLIFSLSLTILQGVWAERARILPFLIFVLLWGLIIYFLIVFNLQHPKGLLNKLDVIDFAGGLSVHVATGFSALAMTLIAKRRVEYFNLKFKFSNTSLYIGTIGLWLGWFGFNAGPGLTLNDSSLNALMTTFISSLAAMISWFWVDILHTPHKSTLKGFALGLVCGLVAITPGCHFLTPWQSLLLGGVAGIVGNYSMRIMNKVFKQDDVLEVFSTHGIVGIFGFYFQLLFNSDPRFTFLNHLFIGTSVACYSFFGTFLLLKIIPISWLLIPCEDETEGLDQRLHGESILNFPVGS